MSKIKVTVEWEAPAVFAGEDVKCVITFKNVAPSARSRSPSPFVRSGGYESTRHRWKLDLSKQQPLPKRTQSLRRASEKGVVPVTSRGHRSALSLSAPVDSLRESSRNNSSGAIQPLTTAHKHGRSVSIISIGATGSLPNNLQGGTDDTVGSQSQRSHHRGASTLGTAARNSSTGKPAPLIWSAAPRRSPYSPTQRSHSSHLHNRSFPPGDYVPSAFAQGKPNESKPVDNFTELVQSSSSSQVSNRPHPIRSSTGITIGSTPTFPFPPAGREDSFGPNFTTQGPSKVLSPISATETPRSSLELYSQSNHSTETLASEYVTSIINRQDLKHGPGPRAGYLTPSGSSSGTEALMMGYVQLLGSFTLDGSLVDLTPFEAIKRKGVIGGQGGGGVVGVESSKRDSGLFGSLGWNSLGQSLGGLIGGQEFSSLKEMKGIANTKAVPIITTPHSILFVDLKLKAGESKAFSYAHTLPTGIPPTYKGRAMKISYQLVVGTQRPQLNSQPQLMRHAEFPFKVLPDVSIRGELPVYNLKSPHIILKDLAHSRSTDERHSRTSGSNSPASSDKNQSSDISFTSYVSSLLASPRSQTQDGLLSPTSAALPDGSEVAGMATTHCVKDLISLAILRGSSSATSPTRFDIRRASHKVATVTLSRAAYRLGDILVAGFDFNANKVPCYAIHASLETVEEVDETIALRSSASITRATRRVQASCFENAVCARRLSLGFMIPTTATPDFRTSGVQLKWNLRIEFTTKKAPNQAEDGKLMEEVIQDERGTVFAAAQELLCENFDVLVPVRVFGSITDSAKDNLSATCLI